MIQGTDDPKIKIIKDESIKEVDDCMSLYLTNLQYDILNKLYGVTAQKVPILKIAKELKTDVETVRLIEAESLLVLRTWRAAKKLKPIMEIFDAGY